MGIIGSKHSKESKEKMRLAKLKNPTRYWLGKKRPNLNIATKFTKGQIPWNKGLKGWNANEKHNNWQGGITPINRRIRMSIEYKNWRKSVFERDDYTCQDCGVKGVYLEADHIKPFAIFPKLRFILSNGRTLCRKCHRKVTNTQMKLIWKNQYSSHEKIRSI